MEKHRRNYELDRIGRSDLIGIKDKDLLAIPIDVLVKKSIHTVALNGLKKAGINTIGDLVAMSLSSIPDIQGVGRKGAREIEEVIHSLDLSFADEVKQVGMPIEETDLSVKSKNTLRRLGFEFVDDLSKLTREDLVTGKIGKKLGQKCAMEVLNLIEKLGIQLEENLSSTISDVRDAYQTRKRGKADYQDAQRILKMESTRVADKVELSPEQIDRLRKLLNGNEDIFAEIGTLDLMKKIGATKTGKDEHATIKNPEDNNRW